LAQIDDLPPLREVIRAHGLDARKSLGQNFLLDLNLTSRIARAAGPLDGRTVLEVGPGPGGLTRALLAAGAERVVAIERDERCLPALADVAARYPGRLDVVAGDALAVDPAHLLGNGPVRIVANLPYNVGTALLIRWLRVDPWPPFWESMTLMFQREVADRIVATPDRPSDYGRLAVLTGLRARARVLFEVSPAAFTPPPKVTSAVVELLPVERPLPCRLEALERVTAAAFGQRRKMLRQSLKPLGDAAALLERAGIDGARRAETLSVSEYAALANALA
jgi:16S rRNA (adenine1518-N6/adenine1519-N6)-dimethyltransferase